MLQFLFLFGLTTARKCERPLSIRTYPLWLNLRAWKTSVLTGAWRHRSRTTYTYLSTMAATNLRTQVKLLFLAATKQLYQWYFPSVCPSVRPSVTPFWLCSPHRIIMKFSGVIANDQSKVHAKGQGQRSKVKVTEVTTQLNRFRTVTPVWILIWWWNDAYSLMLLRRGALLFFKVIRQISRSHGSKNRQIWPRLGVSGL